MQPKITNTQQVDIKIVLWLSAQKIIGYQRNNTIYGSQLFLNLTESIVKFK